MRHPKTINLKIKALKIHKSQQKNLILI